ncbi:MAG: DUF6273 domain-containing protein [Eubacteriales bacterium]|nr:DUF6273 domain-containing protein [Eubacteriales bacterium]
MKTKKHRNKHLRKVISVALSVSCLLSGNAIVSAAAGEPAAETSTASVFSVGAAVRDISPEENMFPLSRKPNVEMVGTLDPIHVRAIALSDHDTTTLMICTETGRSLGPQFAEAIAEHTGLPLEAIFLTSTHSHAAPEITEDIDLDFEEGDKDVTTLQLWAKFTLAQVLEAADEALGSQKPASVGVDYSESYINVNRNSPYNQLNEDGEVEEYRYLGYNGAGESDKTVAAIRFNDKEGEPIAFIVNYAVHGTVMHANTCIDGKTGISSDIPGIVSEYLEDNYDGAVAMWLSGAAGDQNPIVQNDIYSRNPQTGEFEEIFTGDHEILSYLSKIHYADIENAINSIEDYTDNIELDYKFIDATIPGSEGGEYPITLQMMRIGDIGLACFPGELFSSIGTYMKDNSLLEDTIIVNHTWQRDYQNNGYHADDESIELGGFGTNAKYESGYLKETLTEMMNGFYEETGAWMDNGDGTATYSTTGETVMTGLDGKPGTSDDNQIVNPAGTVLKTNVIPEFDEETGVFVSLGNGFRLTPGLDGLIGTTDDVISFGQYAQSDATGDSPSSLDWRLLDINGDEATIICDKVIDGLQFNLNDSDGNDWAESNLRAWLNSNGGQSISGDTKGFYDTAFTDEDKEKILLTRVSMHSDSSYIAYNTLLESDWWGNYTTTGTDTEDYVYSLSGEEMFQYFGLSKIATAEELGHDPANYTNAQCSATLYAQAQGVKINSGGNGASFVGFADVWLRSPGAETDGSTYYGVFLGSTGSCNVGRPVTRTYGARPAVTVTLAS